MASGARRERRGRLARVLAVEQNARAGRARRHRELRGWSRARRSPERLVELAQVRRELDGVELGVRTELGRGSEGCFGAVGASEIRLDQTAVREARLKRVEVGVCLRFALEHTLRLRDGRERFLVVERDSRPPRSLDGVRRSRRRVRLRCHLVDSTIRSGANGRRSRRAGDHRDPGVFHARRAGRCRARRALRRPAAASHADRRRNQGQRWRGSAHQSASRSGTKRKLCGVATAPTLTRS